MQLLGTPLQLQMLGPEGVLYQLPVPSEKFPTVEWVTNGEVKKDIPGKGLRVRVLGYRPVVKVKWAVYDSRKAGTMTVDELLGVTSLTGGQYRIGDGTRWVTVEFAEGPGPVATIIGGRFATDMTFTFHGRIALPTRTLEA